MGLCFSANNTGLNSKNDSPTVGNVLSSANNKVSAGLVPQAQIAQTEGEILQSSNLKRYTFAELRIATGNFRPDNVLGEGGFGTVFKGWIDETSLAAVKPGNGIVIAVKRLNREGFQGGSYFQPLPWSLRMKVALDAAKGLAFLHNAETQVIYRDFKTSNILLDTDYNAKLSDFGLSRDGPEDDETHVSTRVMGTYGYADPEYVESDSRLERKFSSSEAYKVAALALQCLSEESKSRPSMDEVVRTLQELMHSRQTRQN
ncbi:hypothetical protein TSUD_110470 [Trifolium subterraneum]|uniref:Protein kinase domain-containing protein n=1 Tax=Trifolium subterraneum TaxID=3900 RepID=A0A2Z6LIZ5_TRISU|nr:hypothetical protein TSUD_110470 [Trifolium subterraneum]